MSSSCRAPTGGRAAAALLALGLTCAAATARAAEPPPSRPTPGEEHSADTGPPRAEPAGPARPGELPEIETPPPPPWERHLEVGGGVVYVSRPLFGSPPPSTPRYEPAVGFGVHLRWDLLPFLRVHPYFLDVVHGLTLPPGALTTTAPNSIGAGTTFTDATVATFSFGARLEPVLWLSRRVRAWLSAGVGWGRLRMPVQVASDPVAGELYVTDRAYSFAEFPLGIGSGFDVIERWLTIDYDLTVVPVAGQGGEAVESVQAIDAGGQVRDVGPLEPFDVSFVHSLSLAIVL